MPHLTRDDASIYYEVHGQGPAVLLTHGYSATADMWRGQLDALARDHTVVTWDILGHGRSDAPDDLSAYSAAASVKDMAALLDAVGAPRAAIGGLSLGGYLSLAFHLAHPERAGALMLFDTGPGYRNAEARAGWNEMAERMAGEFDQRGLDALSGGAEVRIASHRSATGLARAARGILTQHDDRVIASLPAVAVPTLVLVGADDRAFLAPSEYMAARIPGARLVILDGAGHAANIDQPDPFNQAVLGFLTEAGW
jgi:pimeloyl-ACP methyl ester carboxylesterase